MSNKVYKRNSTVYVEDSNGGTHFFNPMLAKLYLSPDGEFFVSHGYKSEALRLGRYDSIVDRYGNGFASKDEALEFLTNNICKGENDVFLQDQHSNVVDYYMPIPKETLTLASVPTVGTYTIDVVDASALSAGEFVVIKEGTRTYQAKIKSINTNTLTMDTPVDYDFSTDAIIESRIINLNVNGSVTPVIADFKPPPGAIVDINVIAISLTDESEADDGKFGGIPALTNGIVFREARNGGGYVTIFNAKTNGDLKRRMDVQYSERAPTGVYGLSGKKLINSQEGNGVAIRLNGNNGDSLQIVIQDDLTGLLTFYATLRGHVVEY